MTDIPDSGLFSAIKAFQKALGLTITGILNPDDQTIETLNTEITKPKTGYYIWHTVGDSHVRSTHKALEGTIHSWDTSPTPGEDFGCRCWAEPVLEANSSNEVDIKKWDDTDFVSHYLRGNGETVDLESIGVINDVIKKSKELILPKIKEQVSSLAKNSQKNQFEYRTENFYSFKDVLFSLGKSTVKTVTNGTIQEKDKNLIVNASIKFYLTDEFSDPSSLRELFTGSSAMTSIKSINNLTEIFGTPYQIIGTWELPLTMTIKKSD